MPDPGAHAGSRTVDEARIVRAEFLVCPGGLCIPTEGELRIEEVRGVPYLIGHATFERCESWAAARERFAERIDALDPHTLARDVLSELDAFAGTESV